MERYGLSIGLLVIVVVLTEKKRRDKESCKQFTFCNKKKKELWCFTVYINGGALLNFLICLDVLGNFHYD